MLEAMRKGVGTWVAKIFIGLLVLSFAVWGIADIFGGYGTQTVATVGKKEISSQTYQTEFNREMRSLSNRLGRPLTLTEARSLGLDSQVLLRLIGDAAMDNQADELGLGVSGKAVIARIRRDPLFKDSSGQFSQQRYYQLLLSNNLSEPEFLERQRRAIVLEQIASPVTAGAYVPKALSDAANTYQNETRKLAYFTLPLAKAGEIAEPNDEKLREFYNTSKSQFRAPEYRAATTVFVSPETIAKDLEISDADISAYFENNKSRYGQPERRAILQIPFPDAASADEAYKKLKDGADFMEIARTRDLTEKDVDLGLVAKTAILDEKAANEIFKLPVDQLSAPITGDLSTVIAKVTKIEPAVVRTLEDESENIRKLLASDAASAKVLDFYDKIEDERAAGLTLTEIAKKLSLKSLEVQAIDRRGRDEDGNDIEDLAKQLSVVRAIFSADVGVETDPEETADKGYIWYDVRKIIPERQKDFAEAKDDILVKWREERERIVLSKKAQELVDKLNGGASLKDVASELELEVKETTRLKRTARVEGIPNAAIQQAFVIKPGSFGSALTGDNKARVLFQVIDAKLPEGTDAVAAKAISDSLKTSVADDLIVQYVRALRTEFGVEINQNALEEATSGRQYSGGRPAGAL